MTESEAKQWLKHTRAYQHKCDNCEYIDIKGACNEECKDFYDIAIQALSEIQQYRAIGTVEEFKALKEKNGWHDMEMYGLGYNQGTIDRADELQKCREQGYNKAIDEFAEKLRPLLNTYVDRVRLDEVAEQMKGGATDERTGSD